VSLGDRVHAGEAEARAAGAAAAVGVGAAAPLDQLRQAILGAADEN